MSAKSKSTRWFATIALCMMATGLFACGPDPGERKQVEAFWDKGPPPILRFRGEKVFWDGDWVNDGPASFYDELGRLVGEGRFDLGQETGEWTLERNGFTELGSFVSGKRHGDWTYKYPSGKSQEKGRYNMDKREGEWRSFYSNGDLKSIRVYVEGKLKGVPETWDADGHRN
jgi:antitoxin component YwqK of YwqJK toxin-antitoxin module